MTEQSIYIHFTATGDQVAEIGHHLSVEVTSEAGAEEGEYYFRLLDCDDWDEEEAREYVQETIEYLESIGCGSVTDVTD